MPDVEYRVLTEEGEDIHLDMDKEKKGHTPVLLFLLGHVQGHKARDSYRITVIALIVFMVILMVSYFVVAISILKLERDSLAAKNKAQGDLIEDILMDKIRRDEILLPDPLVRNPWKKKSVDSTSDQIIQEITESNQIYFSSEIPEDNNNNFPEEPETRVIQPEPPDLGLDFPFDFFDDPQTDRPDPTRPELKENNDDYSDTVTEDPQTKGNGTCLTPECFKIAEEIQGSMNLSVNPCEDFYQYACGGWIEKNDVPVDLVTWDIPQQIQAHNLEIVKNALERGHMSTKAEKKAKKYYTSCMSDVNPWDNFKEKTENLSSSDSFQGLLHKFHLDFGIDSFFTWNVVQDPRNSSQRVIQVDKSRVMTWQSHSIFDEELLEKMSQVLTSEGESVSQAMVQDILDFEKEIHRISDKSEERTSVLMTLGELQQFCNAVNWTEYFGHIFTQSNRTLLGSSETLPILVQSPNYFRNLSLLLHRLQSSPEKKVNLKNVMLWHAHQKLTRGHSFGEISSSSSMDNPTSSEPRWYHCLTEMNTYMDFLLGAIFVRKTVTIEIKHRVSGLVKNMRYEVLDILKHLDLIDEETKRLADEKVRYTQDMIGYPETLLNPGVLNAMYDKLHVSSHLPYADNLAKLVSFSASQELDKLNSMDFAEGWQMSPQTVNAYFSPLENKMCIPGGILQRPYFDLSYPNSKNYGGLAVVIGHEIVHGLDMDGGFNDIHGESHAWKLEASTDLFRNQSRCLVNQFSGYKVKGVSQIDGEATLDENIADMVGLRASFKAYQKREGKDVNIPGLDLSHDQLFFLSFAQVWCSATKDIVEEDSLFPDVHSPDILRVEGTLKNSKEFAEAFNCPLNSPMDPSQKCFMW